MNFNVKEYKAKKLEEASINNPEIYEGKKLVLGIVLVFLLARLCFVLIETFYVLINNLSLNSCFLNYIMLFISLLFASVIYRGGVKGVAVLALIGGIYSIINMFIQEDTFINLSHGDLDYNMYVFSFLAAMIITIITMIIILANKKCNKYFKVMAIINKEMAEIQVNNKRKLK